MRPKIKITITALRGKICPMAMHCAFPYIDILRYGGTIPGQEKGKTEFCCSDAGTIMVFEAEIVEKKKDERDKADKA